MVQKDTGIPVLIAALFAIAKTCNKPTYPFISEDVVKPSPKILFIRNRVSLPVKLPLKKLFSIEESPVRYSQPQGA